jgi:hypothetical protein
MKAFLLCRIRIIALILQSASNAGHQQCDKNQAAFAYLHIDSYITLIKIHDFDEYQSLQLSRWNS